MQNQIRNTLANLKLYTMLKTLIFQSGDESDKNENKKNEVNYPCDTVSLTSDVE